MSQLDPLPGVEGPLFIGSNSDSNGLLVKRVDENNVYLVQNGKRRLFSSEAALNWNNVDWRPDIITVAPGIYTSFVSNTGLPVFEVGEGESNPTIKQKFKTAYAELMGKPECGTNTSQGWPGSYARCLEFPQDAVQTALSSGVSGISGKFQVFGNENLRLGVIEDSSRGTFGVWGGIFDKWASLNYSGGQLGFPTSHEYQWGAYRRSDFEGGYIRWSSGSGAEVFYTSSNQTLSITISGSGTVTSSPGGINCSGGTCSANFSSGASVQLYPTSGGGWIFTGWGGDADCSDGQVTMSAARSCTATFTLMQPAQMTSPAPSSTLTASTVTFQWTGGVGVSQYALEIGSTAGGADLYSQQLGGLTATVSGLPTDGRTIYVRLRSLIWGVWQNNSYTYTAATTASARAEMTIPAPGSTLTASTVTFQWTGGSGVALYALYVGNTPGGTDYYAQGTNALSAIVSGLPTDGRMVHVRLWSLINGAWQMNDYAYKAGSAPPAKAQLTSPAPGSTLTTSTVTFQWSGGSGVALYALYVGNTPGAIDFYGQGTNNLSATVSGLPTDGRVVHVRLWSLINGAWQANDYTYTAGSTPPAKAQLTSPAPGSTLTASTVTFQWSGGSGVALYALYVGTAPGGSDLYLQGHNGLSATVSGLPTDGRMIYVRLWSLINGAWQMNDYSYKAGTSTPTKAQMTSPAPASTLTASTVTFQWNGGSGVSLYAVYIGNTPGAIDFYGQGTNGLSATVSGLPTDGRIIYVRLWSLINGTWQMNDYSYKAGTATAAKAQLTSPAPGSTLTGSTVTFQWSGGSGVSLYALYVGKTPGAIDFYGQGTNALSATVSGLPTDGRTIYVRLWSLIDGVWQMNDYTYTAMGTATQIADAHVARSVSTGGHALHIE